MKISSEPRAYKLVGSLQLMSAIFLLPLSLLLFIKTGLAVVLGGDWNGSDRVRPIWLTLQTQGGMALALLTLLAGAIAIYASGRLLQYPTKKWLHVALGLQGVIAIAETLKLSIGIRGNWISLLTAVFIVGYLLKPVLQLGFKAIGVGVSQGIKRLPQFGGLKKKV